MISLTKDKELKGYKSLTVYPEVAHFVTTRHGGVSEGTYGSFNCSPYTKDSCINVNCNQNKLFQITGHQIKELVIPEQKHGSASLVVDESFFKESLEVRRTLLRGIDALITNVPGYCVCVTTADCVPVLLYDRRLQVVAAVHAGWKGTVQHIVSRKFSIAFVTGTLIMIACNYGVRNFQVSDIDEKTSLVFVTSKIKKIYVKY